MNYTPPLLVVGLLFSLTPLTTEAALTAGTAGGQSVVYSSFSNITWTGDANLLGTMESSLGYDVIVNAIIAASPTIFDTANAWDTPMKSGYHSVNSSDFSQNLGRVDWFGAQAFVTYLNSINYADSNQWILPSAGSNPQRDYNQTSSQLGELFYNELGGIATKGMPITPYFTFEQVNGNGYWSGTEYVPDPRAAWDFYTGVGIQDFGNKNAFIYAWAVSPGNIAAVPVPGAVWLFGAGIIGLLGFRRRTRSAAI